jgi:hypothetical protein
VRCYVVVPVQLHWCRGAVAPWHRDIVALWRHADAVLVFFDWYDYTTLRSVLVFFIDNVCAGTFSCTRSSRVWILPLLPLLFNYVDRSWVKG